MRISVTKILAVVGFAALASAGPSPAGIKQMLADKFAERHQAREASALTASNLAQLPDNNMV